MLRTLRARTGPKTVVVTGTDTGVGKTITVAALAAAAKTRGERVLVVKPVQTGIREPGTAPAVPEEPAEPPDVGVVARLSGAEVEEFVRLAAPLAPDTAARLERVTLPQVEDHLTRIIDLARLFDTVIVEGAGGLVVRLDERGGTLLDLAVGLGEFAPGGDVSVLVVCRAGLGTLNHTTLTVEALRARGIEPAGLVLGSWPRRPGLAERSNRMDLPRVTGVPVIGVLPEAAGALAPDAFRAAAGGWFSDSGPAATDPTAER